jgi:hypothetical protein
MYWHAPMAKYLIKVPGESGTPDAYAYAGTHGWSLMTNPDDATVWECEIDAQAAIDRAPNRIKFTGVLARAAQALPSHQPYRPDHRGRDRRPDQRE